MNDPTTPGADAGRPKHARIELDEASGPVSPRYQYEVRVRLALDGAKAAFAHHQEGDGASDPDAKIEVDCEIAPELGASLVAEIVAAGGLTIGGDLVGETGRLREGVRANRLTIEVDGVTTQLDYLGPTLKRPEHAQRRAIVDRIKSLHAQIARPRAPIA